jgi:hypothetical protein
MIAAGSAGGAGLAKWLALAASPTFAAMAVLTSLGGMVPMYLLMSVFHAAPWLKLIADR